MNNYKEEHLKGYWDDISSVDGSGVRACWSWDEIKARTDDTISSKLNYKEKDTVLDLGCGIGYACKMVAPQVKKYIGLDFSSGMISQAKEINKDFTNVEFLAGDGRKIPFDDNFFDVIYSEQMFQHMSEEDSYSYFKEVLRTIKTDGSFILQIPRFGRPAGHVYDKTGSGAGMTEEELTKFFDKQDIIDGGLDANGLIHYYYVEHGDRVKR